MQVQEVWICRKQASNNVSAGRLLCGVPLAYIEHYSAGEGGADLPVCLPGGRVWGHSWALPRILIHDPLGRTGVYWQDGTRLN